MRQLSGMLVVLLWLGCQNNNPDVSEDISLNLNPSSNHAELFGEGLISTALYERDMAISPEGDEIIYTLGNYKQTKRCLVTLKKIGNEWSPPELLNISGTFQDIEPFYSVDGNRLYFASNRPFLQDSSRTDYNIWYSDRTEHNWGNPIALDTIINTTGDEFFPAVAASGNLYFTATRADGVGREDIFKSTLTNDKYDTPIALDTAINASTYEFNAYVSPDENWIVFSSFGREDGFGGGDLYYSNKNEKGNWTAARNMGEIINSKYLDYCPFMDWERNNFYFTSERVNNTTGRLDNLEELRSISIQAENGFGNIYSIGLDVLDLN